VHSLSPLRALVWEDLVSVLVSSVQYKANSLTDKNFCSRSLALFLSSGEGGTLSSRSYTSISESTARDFSSIRSDDEGTYKYERLSDALSLMYRLHCGRRRRKNGVGCRKSITVPVSPASSHASPTPRRPESDAAQDRQLRTGIRPYLQRLFIE
jgi:hypothetical protein